MSDNVLPFNPLDKKHLGDSVAHALLESSAVALGGLQPFSGAGIYAIYYSGPFSAYRAIACQNKDVANPKVPIYVGKAVPKGSRKGVKLDSTSTSRALYDRLREHADSVNAAKNLDLKDFQCRYLPVDDIWIPLGEALLIARFGPLWNSFVDGFGNHDPGKGRHNGLVPRWDVLHPGRAWAANCAPRAETISDIERDVVQHLKANSVVRQIRD